MRVTYQCVSESGSFAKPEGKDVTWGIKGDASRILDRWIMSHNQVGSDESMASLLVYAKWTHDATDKMPDWEVKRGRRGGTVWSRI